MDLLILIRIAIRLRYQTRQERRVVLFYQLAPQKAYRYLQNLHTKLFLMRITCLMSISQSEEERINFSNKKEEFYPIFEDGWKTKIRFTYYKNLY